MMRIINTTMITVVLAATITAHADDLDTNTVIRAFQAQAMTIAAAETNTNLKAFLTGKIQDTHHLYASQITFSNYSHRIDSTLSATERQTLILKGQIPELKREGTCWLVESFGGLGAEISGYIDPKSKELILLWIVPEG